MLQASLVLACYLAAALRADALPASMTARHMLDDASASSGANSKSEKDASAVARTSATSTGGISGAFARADAQVVEKTKNAVIRIVVKFIKEAEAGDPVLSAVAGGTAIGEAVAQAYAETVAEVFVHGTGVACADASAEAHARATTYASIVAQVIVGQTRGDPDLKDSKLVALAEASADAMIAATAQAWATATSSTCSTGGFGRAEQMSLARSIARVYAQALAEGYTYVTGEEAEAYSESVAKAFTDTSDVFADTSSGTGVQGNADAVAAGDAAASAFQLGECKGLQATCCGTRYRTRNLCLCGQGCVMNKVDNNDLIVWRPRGKANAEEDCYCKP